MNPELWKGMFIGGMIVLVLLLAIVSQSGRRNIKLSKTVNAASEELLKERNEIGRLQVHHLSQIQCVLTRSAQDQAVDWLARKHREKADRRERIAVEVSGYFILCADKLPAGIASLRQAILPNCADLSVAYADMVIEALDRRDDPPVAEISSFSPSGKPNLV